MALKASPPCPSVDARISPRQISLGDLEVQLRLPGGFISGVEQGHGLSAIFGAQAFLFFGLSVFDVEHAADLTAVEKETTFHNSDLFVRK